MDNVSYLFRGKSNGFPKIMGAFLPLWQGRGGMGAEFGAGGARGFSSRVLSGRLLLALPFPSAGCGGRQGSPPGLPVPLPPSPAPACAGPRPAPPGGLNSALYINRQVKWHQRSPLPSEHPWVPQHPRSAASCWAPLGKSGEGGRGSIVGGWRGLGDQIQVPSCD